MEQKANLDFFLNIKSNESFWLNNNAMLYFCTMKTGRVFVVERRGKCDYKKCGSICCKFVTGGEHANEYWRGFGKKDKIGKYVVMEKTCSHLCRGKCDLWNKNAFPRACKQFPHPIDSTFWEIHKKCGFYFIIRGELKDAKIKS